MEKKTKLEYEINTNLRLFGTPTPSQTSWGKYIASTCNKKGHMLQILCSNQNYSWELQAAVSYSWCYYKQEKRLCTVKFMLIITTCSCLHRALPCKSNSLIDVPILTFYCMSLEFIPVGPFIWHFLSFNSCILCRQTESIPAHGMYYMSSF